MLRFLAVAVLLLSAVGPSAGAQPVALVADLAGEAALRGDAGPRRLALMQRLPVDARLDLAADAHATVFFPADGTAFELRGRGQFVVGADAVRAIGDAAVPQRRQLNAAFRGIRLERVHISQAGVVMRGGAEDGPQPLAPEGLVMSADRLLFRWTAADGAPHYHFRLTDAAGEMVYEATTAATELILPSSAVLPVGRRLMWSVQPSGRLSPRRWASLVVADAAVRATAGDLERVGDSPAERNLRALLLSQQALRGEE